jgi:hypothetical protein
VKLKVNGTCFLHNDLLYYVAPIRDLSGLNKALKWIEGAVEKDAGSGEIYEWQHSTATKIKLNLLMCEMGSIGRTENKPINDHRVVNFEAILDIDERFDDRDWDYLETEIEAVLHRTLFDPCDGAGSHEVLNDEATGHKASKNLLNLAYNITTSFRGATWAFNYEEA